jgi:hypothetical protein
MEAHPSLRVQEPEASSKLQHSVEGHAFASRIRFKSAHCLVVFSLFFSLNLLADLARAKTLGRTFILRARSYQKTDFLLHHHFLYRKLEARIGGVERNTRPQVVL